MATSSAIAIVSRCLDDGGRACPLACARGRALAVRWSPPCGGLHRPEADYRSLTQMQADASSNCQSLDDRKRTPIPNTGRQYRHYVPLAASGARALRGISGCFQQPWGARRAPLAPRDFRFLWDCLSRFHRRLICDGSHPTRDSRARASPQSSPGPGGAGLRLAGCPFRRAWGGSSGHKATVKTTEAKQSKGGEARGYQPK